MSIDLAKALRIVRAATNLSQAAIAKRVSNHESAYSRWESGTRVPSLEQCDLLAKSLGIPFDLLVSLGREDHVVTTEEAQRFLQWLVDCTPAPRPRNQSQSEPDQVKT